MVDGFNIETNQLEYYAVDETKYELNVNTDENLSSWYNDYRNSKSHLDPDFDFK